MFHHFLRNKPSLAEPEAQGLYTTEPQEHSGFSNSAALLAAAPDGGWHATCIFPGVSLRFNPVRLQRNDQATESRTEKMTSIFPSQIENQPLVFLGCCRFGQEPRGTHREPGILAGRANQSLARVAKVSQVKTTLTVPVVQSAKIKCGVFPSAAAGFHRSAKGHTGPFTNFSRLDSNLFQVVLPPV